MDSPLTTASCLPIHSAAAHLPSDTTTTSTCDVIGCKVPNCSIEGEHGKTASVTQIPKADTLGIRVHFVQTKLTLENEAHLGTRAVDQKKNNTNICYQATQLYSVYHKQIIWIAFLLQVPKTKQTQKQNKKQLTLALTVRKRIRNTCLAFLEKQEHDDNPTIKTMM